MSNRSKRYVPAFLRRRWWEWQQYYYIRLILYRDYKWKRAKGDDVLTLEYPLDKNSIAFVAGGHTGSFSEKIQRKFDCQVYLFEPDKKFFRQCCQRFQNSPNVQCFNYGLSNVNGKFLLSDDDNGSSIKLKNVSGDHQEVTIRKFSEVFAELGLMHIDLFVINMEGSEYDILPHIVDSGMIRKIRNLQIQFHEFLVQSGDYVVVSQAKEKRDRIRADLQKTHKSDWCYPFIWESWGLKSKTHEK